MADTKASAFTPLTTPVGNDLVPIIDDPTGTPANAAVKLGNLVNGGYTTTATAAGTTTLTDASTKYQFFTGATTQTIVLPDATTLSVGREFYIDNNSTGTLTINKNGGALVRTLLTLTDVLLVCTDISSAAGVWDANPYVKDDVANTLSGSLTLATGTASAGTAPLYIPAGTLLTTAEDGAIEMDTNALYATTDAGNRGVIPVQHIIRADATRSFTSNTSQQPIFTTPASGALTLETGLYFFEGLIAMTGMSATSGNGKLDIKGTGTATFAAVLWQAYGNDAVGSAETTGSATGGSWHVTTTQTATNILTTATGAEMCFLVKGTFEISGAGTMIPSFALTTASAAVVSIGSYFMVNRVGSTSMTSVGQWA